jgi:hypothetical protein
LYRYSIAGPRQQWIPFATACHVAALSYTGDCLLTADRDQRVCLRDDEGTPRDQVILDGAIVALSLGALGDRGIVVRADGVVLCLDTRAKEG